MSHNQTVSVLHQICLLICQKKENVSIKLCHKKKKKKKKIVRVDFWNCVSDVFILGLA